MLMRSDAKTDRASAILRDCARGALPPNVALMQLFSAAATAAEARAALVNALADHMELREAERLRCALALWEAAPDAFALTKQILNEADHGACAQDGGAIGHWARVFDKAAAVSPEASVALYALGDAKLLAEATAEIVDFMVARNLLDRARAVLDLGCGGGRVLAALEPRVGAAVGIDVSAAMLRHARERCAALSKVSLLRGTGRDLAALRDGAFDLVCAVDSFPYLVNAGMDVAATHMRESARVLRPGGSLLVFNFSYRGDDARDREDLGALARAFGFELLVDGTRPFALWDGRAFHLRKGHP